MLSDHSWKRQPAVQCLLLLQFVEEHSAKGLSWDLVGAAGCGPVAAKGSPIALSRMGTRSKRSAHSCDSWHTTYSFPSTAMTHNIVALNVSGVRFEVDRDLLLSAPDSYFTALLSGPFAKQSEPIFVGVSAKYFEYILDYLRHGLLPSPTCELLEGIRATAKYLSLNAFVDALPVAKEDEGPETDSCVMVYTSWTSSTGLQVSTNPLFPALFSYDSWGGAPFVCGGGTDLQTVIKKLCDAGFEVAVKTCPDRFERATALPTKWKVCNLASDGAPPAKKRRLTRN